jgi:cytochrome c oxidase subunit 2
MRRIPQGLWKACLAVWAGAARADWAVNLPTPKSDVAARIYDLHSLILLICVAIFVVVFGAMFYALFRHRRSAGHEARQFHENTAVEVVWTLIPFVILIGMAWPATRVILNQKDTANPDLTIEITGYQWKWQYDYLQDGIKFMSVSTTPLDQIENRAPKGVNYLREVDQPMVVPAGRKVRVLLTSRDVIHSWWVPELGVKQDAIPGFIRDAWFRASEPGVYRGQCAELCGRGHAFMPIVVVAKTPAEFDQWLVERKAAAEAAKHAPAGALALGPEELKARGEKVFGDNCAVCHQANGQGVPGIFPALAGSRIANGPAAAHIDRVLHGKPGTAMQAFAEQLGDADIAAVITYERGSWGNHGEPVLPADVKARRK